MAKVKTKNWTSGKESRQIAEIIYSSDLLYKILLPQAFFDCWIPFLVSSKEPKTLWMTLMVYRVAHSLR